MDLPHLVALDIQPSGERMDLMRICNLLTLHLAQKLNHRYAKLLKS